MGTHGFCHVNIIQGYMASFSIHVESILDPDTSENILLIAQWIKNSVQKVGLDVSGYHFHALFRTGELTVSCENEKEFKEHALGQSIDLNTFTIQFDKKNEMYIFFSISRKSARQENKNVSIHCDDRSVIQDVASTLKLEKEKFEEKLIPPAPTVLVQGNNNQIGVVNAGDNNQFDTVTVSNKNTIGSQVQPTQKAQLGFWRGVLQFIVSNIIWLTIVAIILIALTVIGITQPDWLQF